MTDVTVLTEGLAMGESARWHDGRFWCSDWVAGEVLAISVDGADAGKPVVVTRSTSFPFCFDWTIDDTMLVTGSAGLERLDADGSLHPYADLSPSPITAGTRCGPLDRHGVRQRHQLDMMGADGMNSARLEERADRDPDAYGERRIVADTVCVSNGMAITTDGSTLLVAESFASRVSAFDIDDDHSLRNRRSGSRSRAVPTESASTPREHCGAPLRAARCGWRPAARSCNGSSSIGRPSRLPWRPDGTTLFMVANEWNGRNRSARGRALGSSIRLRSTCRGVTPQSSS